MKKLKSDKLFEKITGSLNLSRDDIVHVCGYSAHDLEEFYKNVTDSFCLNDPDDIFDNLRNIEVYFIKSGGGCSPIMGSEDGGKNKVIVGRYALKVSAFANDRKWNKKTWNPDNDETLDGPFEIQKSYSSGGQFEPFYSFQNAFDRYLQIIDNVEQQCDLLRPAYLNLGDDTNGMTINEFLMEYGEHPKDLLKISTKVLGIQF